MRNSNDVKLQPLPSPEELASNDETIKVTISLSRKTVEFFKSIANNHKTPYQKMIRRLLDEYVDRHQIKE